MTAVDPNLHALDLLAGVETGFALSVLDSSPDCIKLIEVDGRVSFMNSNGMCAMEIADFGMIEDRPWPALWPAESHRLLDDAMAAARDGRVSTFEAFCPTARGTPRWWHVTVSPVRGPRGHVERILASSRDITDSVTARKLLEEQARALAQEVALKDAALARQKVLLGEIDHRVKNSFASVIALLRMQSRVHSGGEAGALLGDAANRIATLARVHDQLHLDPGADELPLMDYVRVLAMDLGQALNGRIELDLNGDRPVPVKPAQAAAIGQILAELIGNAVKHGGANRQAMIRIRLDCPDDRLRLTVEDDGPGLPEGFDAAQGTGLGMQICQVYTAQMDGLFRHGRSDLGGALFRVELRLDPVEGDTARDVGELGRRGTSVRAGD
ncbi:sensor histidine kinase [Paracoccus sp. T5]|uniref:sensor histidine kinase n=1 Tax=Paracoccus sp. T5 TaxID=3402161 RepID=UPI003ADF2AC2